MLSLSHYHIITSVLTSSDIRYSTLSKKDQFLPDFAANMLYEDILQAKNDA